MAYISKIKTPNNTTYDIKDANALSKAGGTLTGRVTTTKAINSIITGSGTAAQDKGAGVSPRYFPAKWTFNTSQTATNGDIISIKIPVAGHTYGVYVSINNGTNYHPVAVNGTGRLTTQYEKDTYVTIQFESGGSVANIYPVGGGDATTTVTGGCWRVLNFYDSNSDTKVTQTATTADAEYEVLFSTTADNTTRTEATRKSDKLKFNPSTGILKINSKALLPLFVDSSGYISIDYGGNN